MRYGLCADMLRSYFSATYIHGLCGLLLVLHLGVCVARICLCHLLHALNGYSNSRLHCTVASLHRSTHRSRNINLAPISFAIRLYLRGRLTLRRLTLLRKPRACGVRVSRPHCRYSCRHGLLRSLQHPSQDTFGAITTLSYQQRLRDAPQLR